MFPTDPYAVVPSQRAPWERQAREPAATTSQIGGRALLSPGEAPADRVDPYGAVPDPYRQLDDAYRAGPEPPDPDATAVTPIITPNGAAPPGARPMPGRAGTPVAGVPALAGGLGRGRSVAEQALTTARRAAGQGLAAVRRAPRAIQVAAAAGLTAVVLIGIGVVLALASLGGDDGGDAAGGQLPEPAPSAGPAGEAPFEVQEYAGRGMVVNLPAQWQGIDSSELVYVDFVDPGDASAAVRLLAEAWAGDAWRLVEVAEGNISDNPNCPSYQRVGELTEIEVAGRPAVLLEYTCGEGDDMRRARWTTVVDGGTAYSFRLTTRDSEFADHLAIFDELVRSLQLA
jgi:hypothetical protein